MNRVVYIEINKGIFIAVINYMNRLLTIIGVLDVVIIFCFTVLYFLDIYNFSFAIPILISVLILISVIKKGGKKSRH